MDITTGRPNPTLSIVLAIAALFVLGVWAWAWTPAIAAWDNPRDGGFSVIPGVMATVTILPLGVVGLFNALGGKPGQMRTAMLVLGIAVGLVALVGGIELHGNVLEAQDAARQLAEAR